MMVSPVTLRVGLSRPFGSAPISDNRRLVWTQHRVYIRLFIAQCSELSVLEQRQTFLPEQRVNYARVLYTPV
ncbi:hypothetical protein J6590_043723 [Homalodisca vitripennis]|nr:hypothetical protein J6590_043723 [Homalodisca vitripennis]